MKFPRPQSLNGLILVGFGLVALPSLIAVLWALVNLGRLAEQSEQLVVTGVTAAEDNRQLSQQIASLERAARQYLVLRNEDSRALLKQDMAGVERTLDKIWPLAEKANADSFARAIRVSSRRIVENLAANNFTDETGESVIAEFTVLRQRVNRLTLTLSNHIELELNRLQESTRHAQQVSAWQTAALVPGTLILVLFFTVLVAKPIRQIDRAIAQLGKSGFSRPIVVKGPSDLERLGRQLEWLRRRLLELAQEKKPFSSSHVARIKDAACQHSRRHRITA